MDIEKFKETNIWFKIAEIVSKKKCTKTEKVLTKNYKNPTFAFIGSYDRTFDTFEVTYLCWVVQDNEDICEVKIPLLSESNIARIVIIDNNKSYNLLRELNHTSSISYKVEKIITLKEITDYNIM